MAKNRLTDLRDHLFETLEELRDKQEPGDIDRAKAVANIAQAIIGSAKVELQFLELTGQEPQNEFLGPRKADTKLLPMKRQA